MRQPYYLYDRMLVEMLTWAEKSWEKGRNEKERSGEVDREKRRRPYYVPDKRE